MSVRMTEPAITKAVRVAAATRQRRDLADARQPGLRLRVTPAGTATWVLACRDRAGRMRRFTLGRYPGLGIGQARAAARETYHLVRNFGADPVAERRQERAKAAAAKDGNGTLAALLDLYERQRGGMLRSWPVYRRTIRRVFGAFLSQPLADLRSHHLQLAADGYSAQQQAALAVRCLRPVLKWASVPSRCYSAPQLARISPPATPQRRTRVLTREELAKLLPVVRASDRPHGRAILFMLLTLCRREEACGARWGDVDFEACIWNIPATRTKNAQAHMVPLSRQTAGLLRALMPETPDAGSLIFSTRTGGRLMNWDLETKKFQKLSRTSSWHRHDLRRTGATMLGVMGELPDIIEAALNHTSIRSPLAAIYNRSRYRPQVAAALQRLADALDGIEAGAAMAVPLHAGG